jgi:hypothetical protein
MSFWLFFSALVLCAGACSAPALPVLSIRANAILHERAAAQRARSWDYAVTAQLSFWTERQRADELTDRLNPEALLFDESAACSEPTLCLWASAAERSTLLGLGVLR